MYKPRGSIGESMLAGANRRWRRLAESAAGATTTSWPSTYLHSPEVANPNECDMAPVKGEVAKDYLSPPCEAVRRMRSLCNTTRWRPQLNQSGSTRGR